MVGKGIPEEKNTVSVSTSSSLAKKKRRTNQTILSPFPIAQKSPFYSNIAPKFKRGPNPTVRNFHFPFICSNRTELWEPSEEDEEDTYQRFITYEEFWKEWDRMHPLPPSLQRNSMSESEKSTTKEYWKDNYNKRVSFTIPDLYCREISTASMLRGPRPLRVERDISVREEMMFLHDHIDRGWKIEDSFGLFAPASNPRKYYLRHRLNDYDSYIKV